MNLRCINIPSTNPVAIRDFYSLVFQTPYNEVVPNRFEIPVGDIFFVITYTDVKMPVNPDSCGLEFAVDDVDAEYERLLAAGVEIASAPVTYPWGWRAIGFKDPDGNNIDFVAYVGDTKEA